MKDLDILKDIVLLMYSIMVLVLSYQVRKLKMWENYARKQIRELTLMSLDIVARLTDISIKQHKATKRKKK